MLTADPIARIRALRESLERRGEALAGSRLFELETDLALEDWREIVIAASRWSRRYKTLEPSRILNAMDRAAALLRGARIRFAVAGRFALLVHTEPMGTKDVDFVLASADMARARTALGKEFVSVHRMETGWKGVFIERLLGPGADRQVLDLISSDGPRESYGVSRSSLPKTCCS